MMFIYDTLTFAIIYLMFKIQSYNKFQIILFINLSYIITIITYYDKKYINEISMIN